MARRQTAMREALNLVHEGDLLRQKGELSAAMTSYASAVEVLPNAPQAASLRAQSAQRFADVSVQQARALAAEGRFDEAEAVVDRVLSPEFSPSHPGALEFKEQLQDEGFFNRAATPAHLENVQAIKRILIRADGLMDLGRFEEASLTYAEALRIDPYNSAARRGMEQAARQVSEHHQSASRDHTRARMLREVDESWETAPTVSDISGLFDTGVGAATFGLGAREAGIAEKLRAIRFPRIEFLEATLPEVVRYLSDQSRVLDPTTSGRKGLNIILDSGGDADAAAPRRITLSLTNVPLSEVIKYVTELSGTRFRIDEFAVRILPIGADGDDPMRTRSFRVPPNFISQAAAGSGDAVDDPFAQPEAGGGASGLGLRRVTAQSYLSQSGITFPEGASASYLAQTSTLVVTNTEANLDLVERLVQDSFERTAKQVKVDLVLLETTQGDLQELGFDWLLGAFNMPGSDRVFASGGTVGNQYSPGPGGAAADFPFVPPGSDIPVGRFPVTSGLRSGDAIPELTNSIDAVLFRSGVSRTLGVKAPGVFGLSGVFTDPQFQVVLRALNQKKGIDLSMSPSVVTKPGQRATVEVIRDFPYPTEFDPPEIPQSSNSFTGNNGGFGLGGLLGLGADSPPAFPVTPATPTAFENRTVGATLEVEPIISPDNRTVELNLAPEYVEFEGFINYGNPITDGDTILTPNAIIQPVFRVIRGNMPVSVYDGQTVVVGGLLGQTFVGSSDRVPMIGDVPLVGRLFQSNVQKVETKAIVIMVRVQIIDPAGNSATGAGGTGVVQR